MIIVEMALFLTLVAIGWTDYKKHIIPNWHLLVLILLGSVMLFLQGGLVHLTMRVLFLTFVFLLCGIIGGIQYLKKGIDSMGGGDYKLLAVLGFLFGAPGLLLILIGEVIFEFIYRFVLKNGSKGIPLGAPLSIFSILILTRGIING